MVAGGWLLVVLGFWVFFGVFLGDFVFCFLVVFGVFWWLFTRLSGLVDSLKTLGKSANM